MEIRKCKKCGFILGTRPGSLEKHGVCQACINVENYNNINWEERTGILKNICDSAKNKNQKYDCVVAVSGGKDSTFIVSNLVEKFNMKPLLVTVTDEFSHTKAGVNNIKNIAEWFNLDHIVFRHEPETFKTETLQDFIDELHPLKWIEEKIYQTPINIAKLYGIDTVFFGENSAYQYGTSEILDYLHPISDKETKVYFFYAFHPYNELETLSVAKNNGFLDLTDTKEWYRQGNIERFTQIDSVAYIIQLWTKFVKFGFQRVSDMACRYVRMGVLTKEQATQLIKDNDWVCDPQAKEDFCDTIGISQEYFDEIVDKHANTELVVKDANGNWRRKDLL